MMIGEQFSGLFFEWVIFIVTAISSLLLSWGVYKKSRLETVHKFFILSLLTLATAYFFRAMFWFDQYYVFRTISYTGFLFFPLFMTLFLEKATSSETSIFYKLYILLQGTVLIYGLYTSKDFTSLFWQLSFASYHVITIFYLSAKSHMASKRAENIREKQIFRTISICLLLGFVFGALEWASRMGWLNIYLSSIPSLLLVYFFTSIFFSQGVFCLKSHIYRFAIYLVFPVVIYGVGIVLMEDQLSSLQLLQLCFIGYVCFVPINILCQVLGLSSDGNNCELIQRINALPQNDPIDYLKKLQTWGEVTKVHIITPTFCRENDMKRFLFYKKASHHHVYSLDEIQKNLKNNLLKTENRNRLEAMEFLLSYTGCSFLCFLGGTGNILTAEFSSLMDTTYYRGIIKLASKQLTNIIVQTQNHLDVEVIHKNFDKIKEITC